jgi:hypothetical protein
MVLTHIPLVRVGDDPGTERLRGLDIRLAVGARPMLREE